MYGLNRRSMLEALAAVGVSVTAGCGTLAPNNSQESTGKATTDSSTPAPTPTSTPTPSSSVASFQFPDGASKSGIANREAIAEATIGELHTTTHDVTWRNRYGVDDKEKTVKYQLRTNNDSKRLFSHTEITYGSKSTEVAQFISYPDAYVKIIKETDTEFRSKILEESFDRILLNILTSRQYINTDVLADTLWGANFAASKVTERNHRPVIDYDFTGLKGSSSGSTEIKDSKGDLLLDETGLMHHLFSWYKLESGGSVVPRWRELTVNALEEISISRPDWVEEAK